MEHFIWFIEVGWPFILCGRTYIVIDRSLNRSMQFRLVQWRVFTIYFIAMRSSDFLFLIQTHWFVITKEVCVFFRVCDLNLQRRPIYIRRLRKIWLWWWWRQQPSSAQPYMLADVKLWFAVLQKVVQWIHEACSCKLAFTLSHPCMYKWITHK